MTWSAARVYPKGNRGVENVLGGTWRGEPIIARMGPESVADAAVFLSSEESRFITGQTLFVDGGAIMH
ncbi:SDR family oxidoreductase [Aurantiacibacter xanthus]|uniref:SDR family oxidoreductase n=1 Tax=Aurantiacibacter xanthus TaxID=1784712 RepID=UPI0024831D9D|nr:SDR family oxidoreductase [Aurantiacibacter xanthus]